MRKYNQRHLLALYLYIGLSDLEGNEIQIVHKRFAEVYQNKLREENSNGPPYKEKDLIRALIQAARELYVCILPSETISEKLLAQSKTMARGIEFDRKKSQKAVSHYILEQIVNDSRYKKYF